MTLARFWRSKQKGGAKTMTKRSREDYDETYNETSNTAAGINTPRDHEDYGPLDMVSDAVEEMVDNVEHAFDGNETDEAEQQPAKQKSFYDRHSF